MGRFMIVGAGLAGTVLAREIVERSNSEVFVVDKRVHLGGNCYSRRDSITGVMVHEFGPHIFHSPDPKIYAWADQFLDFQPYQHRGYGVHKGKVYPLPVNLLTLSLIAGQSLTPRSAQAWLDEHRIDVGEPDSFERYLLGTVGPEVFEIVFRAYTEKQWGTSANQLPASVAKRIPIRLNFNMNYHHSRYVGIPSNGYLPLFEKLLDHPRISVELDTPFDVSMSKGFDHTFFSGPIDSFFDYRFGPLGYRSVRWEHEVHHGDYQGTPTVNSLDASEPHTRIIEHKHFEYWNSFEKSLVSTEFSFETGISDEPYYPKRLAQDKTLLAKYSELAGASGSTTFIGRLGTYRYLDMWQVIREMKELAKYGTDKLSLDQIPRVYTSV